MIPDLQPYARFFRPGFLGWLAANKPIYYAFEQQALILIRKEWKRFSARTIVEELRHYTRHRERGNCSLKINDHAAPDLARVFTVLHPQYARFWEYRRPDWPEFLRAVEQATK
jgi:hypothetical protein